MRPAHALATAVLVAACSSPPMPAAPLAVAAPPPREDPRRALVAQTLAALTANDRQALLALADADELLDRILLCNQPTDARRAAVAIRFRLVGLARRFAGQTLEVVDVGEVTSRTVRRRGERVDTCEHKLAAEHLVFDVWLRGADRRELRLRMNVVRVEGRLYLADAPRTVRPEGPADRALLDQLETLADSMCACPDDVCAEQVQRDLARWTYTKSKAVADGEVVDASPDSAARHTELLQRIADCRKQVP